MLSSLWGSDENDSEQNLARRPSSMGSYLLKLKRRSTDDVRAAILAHTDVASEAGAAALIDPFRQWNKRWLNIEGHYLRWYSKVASSRASGGVDLRHVTCLRALRDSDLAAGDPSSAASAAATAVTGADKGATAFLVESRERPLVLRCSSPAECARWLRMLHMIADRARGGDGSRSVPSSLSEGADSAQTQAHAGGGLFSHSSAVYVSSDGAPGQGGDRHGSGSSSLDSRPGSAELSVSSRNSSSTPTGMARHKKRKEKAAAVAAKKKAGATSVEGRIDAALSSLVSIENGGGGAAASAPAAGKEGGAETASGADEANSRAASGTPSLAGRMQHRKLHETMSSPPAGNGNSGGAAAGTNAATSSSSSSTVLFRLRDAPSSDVSLSPPTADAYSTHTSVYPAEVSEAVGADGSMGLRLRRNIEDNPLANEDNNRHGQNRLSSASAGGRPGSAGCATGIVGLGCRKVIGFGTGATESRTSHATATAAKAKAAPKQVDAEEAAPRWRKQRSAPMPGVAAPMPDAYRIKKDDILRKLGASNAGAALAPSGRLPAKKAWGSPGSTQVSVSDGSVGGARLPGSPTNAALLSSMDDLLELGDATNIDDGDLVARGDGGALRAMSPENHSIVGVVGTNASAAADAGESAVRTFSAPSTASDLTTSLSKPTLTDTTTGVRAKIDTLNSTSLESSSTVVQSEASMVSGSGLACRLARSIDNALTGE